MNKQDMIGIAIITAIAMLIITADISYIDELEKQDALRPRFLGLTLVGWVGWIILLGLLIATFLPFI